MNSLKGLGFAVLAALPAGTASAAFLVVLDAATSWRESHRWILAFLPAAGFGIGWIYHRWGAGSDGGTPRILEEIRAPEKALPLRMAPLVFAGTIVSHLFGASVGREGTAVQMGGALADGWTRLFRLGEEDRRLLLLAGLAAGFASVFGTPLAGAVFALEVVASQRFRVDAILPCLAAAFLADRVTLAWGVKHTAWPVPEAVATPWAALPSSLAAGVLFGMAAWLFVRARDGIGAWFRAKIGWAPLRPLIGGALIAAAVGALGTSRYDGLGIPVMQEAFAGRALPWDFAAKLLLTALALGAGFKGGEVTPLFFMGATLGALMAVPLGLSVGASAALGFVALFAGVAQVPLAGAVLAVELFGPGIGVYAGLACVASAGLAGWLAKDGGRG